MKERLARVRWEMGQTLLPEHFVELEESLLAHMAVRHLIQGLPYYGIAQLSYNEALLKEGVFSITSLLMIMRSGVLISIPGNASVSPFNLNVPGEAKIPLYLHLLMDEKKNQEKSFISESIEEEIPKVYYKLVLSTEQNVPDTKETLKIAEFEKTPEGIWDFSKSFIPSLLQIGPNPFLKEELKELDQTLELFQYNLTLDAASYLSGESLYSVKQCLKNVFHIRRLIANLNHQIHIHPYFLYEELKRLYTEICFYKNTTPDDIIEPYNHDELYKTFSKILKPLLKEIQVGEKRQPYLPFEFFEGVYRVKLPKEVREARQVYFLVQKLRVSDKVPIEKIKLAALSRLSFVHRMALMGIPLEKTDRPPFQHAFGPEVEFYRIIEGEEWDKALNEGVVAFYGDKSFEELEFYIYWRMG